MDGWIVREEKAYQGRMDAWDGWVDEWGGS